MRGAFDRQPGSMRQFDPNHQYLLPSPMQYRSACTLDLVGITNGIIAPFSGRGKMSETGVSTENQRKIWSGLPRPEILDYGKYRVMADADVSKENGNVAGRSMIPGILSTVLFIVRTASRDTSL